MPLLFSYGTLQDARVQLATFGRRLDGHADVLPGFETSQVRIDDPAEVAAVGLTHYQNAVPSSRVEAQVPGMALDVTEAELAKADEYERPAAYVRVAVVLASGTPAWVYVHAPSSAASRA
jgi:gamma-glutamylcyclotransferase (GGCT)/AIG2-like uncharacterized protein YtfP